MQLYIKDTLRKWRTDREVSREMFAKMADTTAMTMFRAETTGKISLETYIKIHQTVLAYEREKAKQLNPNPHF
jgi:hypothetical protein